MFRLSRMCLIIFIIIAVGLVLRHVGMIQAEDEVEQLQREIDELSNLRKLSEDATAPLEQELSSITTRINSIQYQLKQAEVETDRLAEDISDREDDLSVSYQFLALRARSYYKLSKKLSPIMALLAADDAADVTRQLSYRAAATGQDREAIVDTTQDILGLEEDRDELEQRKVQLAALTTQFEKDATFFKGEIQGARAYQAELSEKIAELSARQKEILAQKSATFQTTVGDVATSGDPASRPDYNPGFSPAFAVFSFGAPHYKGMSQYGALGRAQAGQSYEDILRAYYGDIRIETVDSPGSIATSVGTLPFEDNYLKGIAEMPTSWSDKGGMEALKAQAIAARTYALSYVGWRMGDRSVKKSICTTEQCQVYNSGKAAGGAGAWYSAVDATRGKVVVGSGTGEIFATWYASTSGGYQESYSSLGHTTPALWDTPEGRSGWTTKAYENTAGSPWFYKGWYTSRSGDACGRSHPWLTSEQLADILNAWQVVVQAGDNDDRITPEGPCWGGSPYSIGELRDKANSRGGGFSSVSSVSVSYSDSGVTANVTLGTDRGSVTIDGSDFKKAFNLRAPGRVAIKSGLFNIEKK